MLLDRVGVVLRDGRASHEADLPMLAHPLRIYVEMRRRILAQDAAALEGREVFETLRVYGVGVLVGPLRQVDLGPGDVEVAVGVAPGDLARLASVHDVIGGRGDATGRVGGRAQGAEGSKQGHGVSSALGSAAF